MKENTITPAYRRSYNHVDLFALKFTREFLA